MRSEGHGIGSKRWLSRLRPPQAVAAPANGVVRIPPKEVESGRIEDSPHAPAAIREAKFPEIVEVILLQDDKSLLGERIDLSNRNLPNSVVEAEDVEWSLLVGDEAPVQGLHMGRVKL